MERGRLAASTRGVSIDAPSHRRRQPGGRNAPLLEPGFSSPTRASDGPSRTAAQDRRGCGRALGPDPPHDRARGASSDHCGDAMEAALCAARQLDSRAGPPGSARPRARGPRCTRSGWLDGGAAPHPRQPLAASQRVAASPAGSAPDPSCAPRSAVFRSVARPTTTRTRHRRNAPAVHPGHPHPDGEEVKKGK